MPEISVRQVLDYCVRKYGYDANDASACDHDEKDFTKYFHNFVHFRAIANMAWADIVQDSLHADIQPIH